ncbi:ABC transporter permease [Paenibacillus oenotherae]|uniref:ABC transporter permease n=1 Tax=Paenibacillus oenotherae TaxID=1435645 RepID=A0ABS7D862_9BACL|nr:ABC transporter permease [Paenibacillus oenotherae]MBW7475737.1 ABC transporter permease [Paenibacillus oenotherae]
MKIVVDYLKDKLFVGGITMLIFYQIIMITIYMGGYSAVPRNLTELTVAIVNEDAEYGAEFAERIKEELPFKMKSDLTLDQAKQELDEHDLSMVVHIPADFTSHLTKPEEQVQLNFFINNATAQTVSSTMQTVANQIASELSQQLKVESMQSILQGMQVPEEQAVSLAEGAVNKVKTNMIPSNVPPAGMHNLMAPMFLTIVSYVGAMIFSMMAVSTLNKLKSKHGKWRAFFTLQGLIMGLSLIGPLVGLGIYFAIQGYGADVFFRMWLSHALEMFVAVQVTSVITMLLGQAAMLINMPYLLIQVIGTGAIMPQEMMSGFFKFFSSFSVLHYSVETDYSLLFGGGNVAESISMMGVIGAAALLINLVIHKLKAASNTTKAEIEVESAALVGNAN